MAEDYCPNCGCYHKIYGPCDSKQTEPNVVDLRQEHPFTTFQEMEEFNAHLSVLQEEKTAPPQKFALHTIRCSVCGHTEEDPSGYLRENEVICPKCFEFGIESILQ